MNNFEAQEKKFDILRKIAENSELNQRKLARSLGYSLGKLNYCILELKKKGLIKFNNFSKKKNKVSYARYVLTPKGIKFRAELTLLFMKKKLQEYDELKKEINNIDDN